MEQPLTTALFFESGFVPVATKPVNNFGLIAFRPSFYLSDGMNVFVQRTLTREYFCMDETWRSNPKLARDFETAGRAAEFCHDMEHVQIIVRFDGKRPPLVVTAGKPSIAV